MQGKREENHLQRALRLTPSPWPLPWLSQAGQTLGPTQQVSSDAIKKPRTFPSSSAKYGTSIGKFPSLKQDCQMDMLIYLCIMQAASTRDKPGRGCIAHQLAVSPAPMQWETEWAALHLLPGTTSAQAVTAGLLLCIHTSLYLRLTNSCSCILGLLHWIWKLLAFFHFLAKGPINVFLPRVSTYSISDSHLPCELLMHAYATSKF